METVLNHIRSAFRHLILRPLDFMLFGGSGVLWRSRDEWRSLMKENPAAFAAVYERAQVEDSRRETSPSPLETNFLNRQVPSAYYGPIGEHFLVDPDI